MDETKAMVEMYSLVRSECKSVISAVIDVRYSCVWAQDDIYDSEVVQDV